MAFEGLSEKLNATFKHLRGKGRLSEEDIKLAMREVRLALLEADVSYKVVKDFVKTVSERAVGTEVLDSLTPAQQVIKIVSEELTALMGGANAKLTFASKPPTVVMMVGLQGAGKTTNVAKLAGYFRKQGHRPLLTACDVYRPAAITQLQVVGKQLNIPVFEMGQIDPAGVRHTAMLAMAKLEYPAEELKRFRSAHSVPYLANTPLRRRPKDAERDLDPWTLIALMSAAWRELDYEGAEHYLRILVRSCPHAAEALYFQTEFPDGVYARVNVGVGSTDELVLALSEATPVLQEGLGAPDNASFAAWVATNDIVRSQIDERILRAAEQGLPFKGGDL